MSIGINLEDTTDYYEEDKMSFTKKEVELILFALVRAHHTTIDHDRLENRMRKWIKKKQ